ncbi:hypothetical protein [Pseudomonas brenneri]|uniref:hypothetical protein n=1 Tax=Pseudomonas brenneri TaxID=129817 RepID=UPI003BA1C731
MQERTPTGIHPAAGKAKVRTRAGGQANDALKKLGGLGPLFGADGEMVEREYTHDFCWPFSSDGIAVTGRRSCIFYHPIIYFKQ